jgi:hypothetical protein
MLGPKCGPGVRLAGRREQEGVVGQPVVEAQDHSVVERGAPDLNTTTRTARDDRARLRGQSSARLPLKAW